MSDNSKILQGMTDALDHARAPELDSLISSLHSGVTVVPSDMVTKTTILVTPKTWRLLCERIDRDTALNAKTPPGEDPHRAG